MTQRELLCLLALLAENVSSPATLARELVIVRSALSLCDRETWRPSAKAWHLATRHAYVLDSLGIACLAVYELPPLLTRPNPPPPALFVRGDASLLARPAIAIVGSRHASSGALQWAAQVATQASEVGWLVVSGGARGIDAAAHHAALRVQKPTVVFLGVAADRIYPPSHRRLFARVIEQRGALVSEYPPFAHTPPWCHAARNRLIAAQAQHVVVAEAAATSGSLGTAAAAKRMGTPVWVPPANVGGARDGIGALLASGCANVLPAGFPPPLPC